MRSDLTTDIELVLPNERHGHAVPEYKEEFTRNNEVLHGSAGLDHAESFETWLENVREYTNPETVPKGRVLATVFLAFRKSDGKLVGMIDVRHELNDFLLAHGGHIGYSVRKSERRKGYATQMLQKALSFCRELGMEKVLVTCDKANPGSSAVIKTNGGVLENEIIADDGVTMQRYWILL